MIHTWRQLMQEQTWLALSTAFTAVLLIPTLLLLFFDSRTVNGANPWLKPLKFEVSVAIFNLTVMWLVSTLRLPPVAAALISRTVALAMFVEIAAIVLQAARGVPSHYNLTTPFNALVFGSMAMAIIANTLSIIGLGILSFAPQQHIDSAFAWGIRLGVVLFLLSSVQGFQIVGNNGHTVGAADGGPGLPFLRWSTKAGDLRIAHFVGLHALQILPILGLLLTGTRGTVAVAVSFCLISALFFWAWTEALAGRPLLQDLRNRSPESRTVRHFR
jgi:hypothetical protein